MGSRILITLSQGRQGIHLHQNLYICHTDPPCLPLFQHPPDHPLNCCFLYLYLPLHCQTFPGQLQFLPGVLNNKYIFRIPPILQLLPAYHCRQQTFSPDHQDNPDMLQSLSMYHNNPGCLPSPSGFFRKFLFFF